VDADRNAFNVKLMGADLGTVELSAVGPVGGAMAVAGTVRVVYHPVRVIGGTALVGFAEHRPVDSAPRRLRPPVLQPRHCGKRRFLVARRHWLRYESKNQPLLPRKRFALRLGRHFAVASLLIGASLLAGMVGYSCFEGMGWIDAFANAAMILSGMGPLAPLQTPGGKVFAGVYALFSGLVLIVATGIILAPVLHRMLHQFHVEAEEEQG
jgi:hypothetical protein